MKYQIMEIDENGPFIEACQISSWRKAGLVWLGLKKLSNTENIYSVEFIYGIAYSKLIFDKASEKSKVTNTFVELLITEPKEIREKQKLNE